MGTHVTSITFESFQFHARCSWLTERAAIEISRCHNVFSPNTPISECRAAKERERQGRKVEKEGKQKARQRGWVACGRSSPGVSAKCNEVGLLISCSGEAGEKSESISKVAAVARKNSSHGRRGTGPHLWYWNHRDGSAVIVPSRPAIIQFPSASCDTPALLHFLIARFSIEIIQFCCRTSYELSRRHVYSRFLVIQMSPQGIILWQSCFPVKSLCVNANTRRCRSKYLLFHSWVWKSWTRFYEEFFAMFVTKID